MIRLAPGLGQRLSLAVWPVASFGETVKLRSDASRIACCVGSANRPGNAYGLSILQWQSCGQSQQQWRAL